MFSCIICWEAIKNKDTVVAATCGHVFHKICLEEWLMKSKTCPHCRFSITSSQFHKIFLESDENIESELEKANNSLKIMQEKVNENQAVLETLKNDIKEKNEDNNALLETLKKDLQQKEEIILELNRKLESLDFENSSKSEQIASLETIIVESPLAKEQKKTLDDYRLAGHKASYSEALRETLKAAGK